MRQIYIRTSMLRCDLTSGWVFSCKFAAYFQNTFSKERLWRAASEKCWYSVSINPLQQPGMNMLLLFTPWDSFMTEFIIRGYSRFFNTKVLFTLPSHFLDRFSPEMLSHRNIQSIQPAEFSLLNCPDIGSRNGTVCNIM